jgi:hypothetical protein
MSGKDPDLMELDPPPSPKAGDRDLRWLRSGAGERSERVVQVLVEHWGPALRQSRDLFGELLVD